MDNVYEWTEEQLKKLEKEIWNEYSKAYVEMHKKADSLMETYHKQNKEKLKQVKDGKLSKDDYEEWLKQKSNDKAHIDDMASILLQNVAKANEIAVSTAKGYLPSAYAENFNYGTYEVEHGSKISTSFTLYDKQTVERLMKKNPKLLPDYTPDIEKFELWNKKKLSTAITQSILQGEGIPQVAKRLRDVAEMDKNTSIRNARTMMTSAQNGGRIDSYKRAENMGIKVRKQWLATLDGRTRDSHRKLDGQIKDIDKPFEAEFGKIMFPADPSAHPAEVYNCRCTLVGVVKGLSDSVDPSLRDSRLGNMGYEEWKKGKAKMQKETEKEKVVFPNIDIGKENGLVKLVVNQIEKWASAHDIKRKSLYYNEVKNLDGALNDEQIIKKLAGADKTNGSCASAAIAFEANKLGLDVLDFRGGESTEIFSEISGSIQRAIGVEEKRAFDKKLTEVKNAFTLLNTLKDREQAQLTVGYHTSIVRRVDDRFEYLELQSSNSGWRELTSKTMNKRFSAHIRKGGYDTAAEIHYWDRAKNIDRNGLAHICGYINTDLNNQKKGKGGGAK